MDLYRNAVKSGSILSSREHTAQVSSEDREKREEDFREARLPVLYCSPTMELGVDISQLNVVGMRNVPPTPANYAQRSGRAGRSGQPALILTYCAQGNSHDQHFFRQPEQMVAGSVATPRIDLANEDLIRAHIHAIWLTASRLDLRKSVGDLLDLPGKDLKLELQETVRRAFTDQNCLAEVRFKAGNILRELEPELKGCGWHDVLWLDRVINDLWEDFEKACDRWRSLYRAAVIQRDLQTEIASDASLSREAHDNAEKLRLEALKQYDRLRYNSSSMQSDFYSYRYFASEGFLPGYNFPRLPLTAFIPDGRGSKSRDSSISRARFLAISEFGPGSIIYHEGAKYAVVRAILDSKIDGELVMQRAKICENCGWLEPEDTADICEMCGSRLPSATRNMFRMSSAATVQRARISSDEEERQRFGYQIASAYRFEEHGGMPSHKSADLAKSDGEILAHLKYGHGATLQRVNMGWLNRPDKRAGFLLAKNSGRWVKDVKDAKTACESAQAELDDPGSAANVVRVIPYVEDRKNCLTFEPAKPLTRPQMLSLQAALKQAIQQLYQLEDFELASEVMPGKGEPRTLLFIEAAEGGAGVLRHFVEDVKALPAVASQALAICHFDREGNDLGKAPNAADECVAACYDCLMNYANQRDHKDLNRHAIRDILLQMADGKVAMTAAATRASQLQELKKACDTKLERDWLDLLVKLNLKLPDKAQYLIEKCGARVDFWYEAKKTAIFIDGPVHEYSDQRDRDAAQEECLEDLCIPFLRFVHGEQWLVQLKNHPEIFGAIPERPVNSGNKSKV